MTTPTNFGRARLFRQGVVAWLQGHGFPDADVPRPRRTPEAQETPQSDVLGLPPSWFVDVGADKHARLSDRLNTAQRDAAEAGAEHAAVILARSSYGDNELTVGESFVLMSLSDFAAVVRKAEFELEAAS